MSFLNSNKQIVLLVLLTHEYNHLFHISKETFQHGVGIFFSLFCDWSQQEIEEDKKKAEQEGIAVTTPRKPRPHEPETDRRRMEKENFTIMVDLSKPSGVRRDSTASEDPLRFSAVTN